MPLHSVYSRCSAASSRGFVDVALTRNEVTLGVADGVGDADSLGVPLPVVVPLIVTDAVGVTVSAADADSIAPGRVLW